MASDCTAPEGRTGRQPRILADGEVSGLGDGKRVRYLDAPHVPHGWEAGVLYEESTVLLSNTRHAAH